MQQNIHGSRAVLKALYLADRLYGQALADATVEFGARP
jgi:hypothetical protein